MEGFLLVDKPKNMTSHDVVDAVRRASGVKRVGHAGTLDPFATGLLIVGVGRTATREFQKLVGLDKDYEAVFVLGMGSDTDDITGKIQILSTKHQTKNQVLNTETIKQAMKKFVGDIEQTPPAFSAIKIGGKKMYEAAREGKPLEAKPRRVTVSRFDLLDPQPLNHSTTEPLRIQVRISCSSGTYVRALARDLGLALGTLGLVEELRRMRIGPFSVDDAIALKDLTASTWQQYILPPAVLLGKVPTET